MELENAGLATGGAAGEALGRWLVAFSRHLVALCGATVELGGGGEVVRETFFCYTGFLIEVEERWYLVTAGHCLTNLEAASVHPGLRLTGLALAGGFGPAGACVAVPFRRYDARCGRMDDADQGLDYGWVEIPRRARDALEQAGARPTPLPDGRPLPGAAVGHFIVGFPDELVGKNLNAAGECGPVAGEFEPVLISVDWADAVGPAPADPAADASPWFVGRLDPADQLGSPAGLSGGPIVEVAAGGSGYDFRLVALQSRWLGRSRTVFGCLASNFLPRVLGEIRGEQPN